MRWALRLQEYMADIKYHPGKENGPANALSWMATYKTLPMENILAIKPSAVTVPMDEAVDFKAAYEADPFIWQVTETLCAGVAQKTLCLLLGVGTKDRL